MKLLGDTSGVLDKVVVRCDECGHCNSVGYVLEFFDNGMVHGAAVTGCGNCGKTRMLCAGILEEVWWKKLNENESHL